LHTISWMQ